MVLVFELSVTLRLEGLVTELSKRDNPDLVTKGQVLLSEIGGSATLTLLDRNCLVAQAWVLQLSCFQGTFGS